MNKEYPQLQEFLDFQHIIRLAGAASLEEALPLCADAIMKAGRNTIDCCGIFLLDHFSGLLKLHYHRGLSPQAAEAMKSWDVDSDEGRFILCRSSREFVFSELPLSRDPVVNEEGIRGGLVIPFLPESEPIGCCLLCSGATEEIPRNIRHDLEALCRWFESTVSRLSRSQRQMREAVELLSLFDAINEMILAFGINGELIWTNEKASDRLGCSENDSVHLLDLFPEEWSQEAARTFRRMFEGEQKTCGIPLQTSDGSILPASSIGVPGHWRGINVLFLICHASKATPDGDHIKRTETLERRVRELETRLEEIASHIEAGELAGEV
ncbi:MAG: PAS domain-containing protein [Synergistota bacterium]|nr:PAS domain-containing protein [Synergistota bacterium]